VSNEVAVSIIALIGTLLVAVIAWLTRDNRRPAPESEPEPEPEAEPAGQATLPPPLTPPANEVEAYLLKEVKRLSKRLDSTEQKLKISERKRLEAEADATHWRGRVTELEISEKTLKAEVIRLRGLVEKPGTGPLGKN